MINNISIPNGKVKINVRYNRIFGAIFVRFVQREAALLSVNGEPM